jgi:hypothetical protein
MYFHKIFNPNFSYSDAREIAIYLWSKKNMYSKVFPRETMFDEIIKDFSDLEHKEWWSAESKLRSIFFNSLIIMRRYVVPSLLDECGVSVVPVLKTITNSMNS